MLNNNKKYYMWLGAGLFALTILPLIYLCFFIHPSDNDNWISFQAWKNEIKLIQWVSPLFRRIGHRYSACIFVCPFMFSIIPLPEIISKEVMSSILIHYRLLSVAELIFFTFSSFILFYSINTYLLKFCKELFFLLYSIFYFIIINSSSYIFHTFYEMITASGYTFGLSLFLIFIGLSIRYYYTNKGKVFLFIVMYLGNGCLEIFPMLFGSVILYLVVYKYVKEKKIDIYFIILGFISLFILLAYIFNPFQKVKIEMYANGGWTDPGSRLAIPKMVQFIFEYIVVLLKSLKIFIDLRYSMFAWGLIIPVSVQLYKRNIKINFLTIMPFYIVILLCGFMFHYCYLSIIGLERANNIISILMGFLNIIFFTSLLLTILYLPKVNKFIKHVKNILIYVKEEFSLKFSRKNCIFVILLVLLYTGHVFLFFPKLKTPGITVKNCYYEILTGHVNNYNIQLNERYKEIIESDNPVVYVKRLKKIPKVIFYTDNLSTGSMAVFFAKDKIMYEDDIIQ